MIGDPETFDKAWALCLHWYDVRIANGKNAVNPPDTNRARVPDPDAQPKRRYIEIERGPGLKTGLLPYHGIPSRLVQQQTNPLEKGSERRYREDSRSVTFINNTMRVLEQFEPLCVLAIECRCADMPWLDVGLRMQVGDKTARQYFVAGMTHVSCCVATADEVELRFEGVDQSVP